MGCTDCQNCGGCRFRDMKESDYRILKEKNVRSLLEQNLGDLEGIWEAPKFLPDGTRRRASLTFEFKNHRLEFGFNENKSHQIADVKHCAMLRPKINEILFSLRELIEKLCMIPVYAKKQKARYMTEGDVLILEVQNGLDIVLESDIDLGLEHRLEIADFMNACKPCIRFSFRKKHTSETEPIIEKAKPVVQIADADVLISSGEFLQASEEGEAALISLVKKYIGQTRGKMADLFCGIGTFSYALSNLENTDVLAVDCNKSLLQNFQKSVHALMIQNIEIKCQNLFLYPLTPEDLKDVCAVVFDPPRAGAKAQAEELCKIKEDARPQKIIAVSCMPETFARDAKILINGGYVIKNITMVDQFVYSNHSELVGLFTNGK